MRLLNRLRLRIRSRCCKLDLVAESVWIRMPYDGSLLRLRLRLGNRNRLRIRSRCLMMDLVADSESVRIRNRCE
jgi:hypothetical protein